METLLARHVCSVSASCGPERAGMLIRETTGPTSGISPAARWPRSSASTKGQPTLRRTPSRGAPWAEAWSADHLACRQGLQAVRPATEALPMSSAESFGPYLWGEDSGNKKRKREVLWLGLQLAITVNGVCIESAEMSRININKSSNAMRNRDTMRTVSSPCSGDTTTPHWVSRGEAGWGSGCGRTTDRCHNTAARLRLYTLCRTPCGRPLPRPAPLPPPPPRLWPPTGCPLSPESHTESHKGWILLI